MPVDANPKGPAARPSGLGLTSERARAKMVERVRSQGVRDEAVLSALGAVARHGFVDQALASRAYEDVALPIGHAQTISRPTVVGTMIAAACGHLDAAARRRARVLEVGTGCGYQAAVLARLFGEVYSIERIRALHEQARANVRALRLPNLRLAFGDGREGLPEVAPFDAIVIAAAGLEIPDALLLQMAVGGRLVAPVGGDEQVLHRVERVSEAEWHTTIIDAARFVPLRSGTA